MVITIDGPAGAGKTTVAKFVAKKKKIKYIDTGSLYRYFTMCAMKQRINLDDANQVLHIIKEQKLATLPRGAELRKNSVTKNVFNLADKPEIRNQINRHIRRLARIFKNVVTEGRDQGGVVFRNATRKFYLDADLSERAGRRQKELKTITLEKVLEELRARDKHDMTRQIAPLKRTKDMIYIDTTKMTINQVVEKILSYL